MRLTLRSKILFYLLIVSFSGILLTSFSILWGFESEFDEYLQKDRAKSWELIENEVIQTYKDTGKLINNQLNNLLHQQAMTENLYYTFYDASHQLVADTSMMLQMMESMGVPSDDQISTDYLQTTHDITFDGKTIGTIEAFYPKGMIGEEVTFLETIRSNIYIAIIVTVILAILFSLLFSKRLTSGFDELSKAIQDLKNHQRRARVPINKLTDEMKPLAESFNLLAESLAKEELLRKQYTADFAHELRTPLATLRSQLEAIQDGVFEPTKDRLQKSHNELMRLVRLVNELETLIAAENPQINLNKANLEAGQIISLLEVQFKSIYREKGVHLNVRKPEKEYWFVGDHDRIVQVLTNILNNALQYTPKGKKVWIEVNEEDEYVVFLVKDQGSGIAEEDIPNLFERFYRGDKSRDRKTGGIGIGLSIVKALVEAHHGKINITSKLNLGTQVTIYLPK